MRGFRWLLVALLLVFSAGVAWACGGDEEEDETGAPVATSPAEETPEAREGPEDGGEFADLAQKFGGATFKVTYEMSGLGEIGGGTMTWYKKGDSTRMDIESEIEGQKVSAVIITRPDQSYFCTEIPGLGEGSCLETSDDDAEGVGDVVADLEDVLSDPDADVVSTGSRNIAGEDADCFTVRMLELETETEVCTTEDGVPLSMRSTMEGEELSLEAIDFSRDVSDDDFEPPYPIGEGFPGLPDIDIDLGE
jgi:hypothetical protein